MLLGVHRVGEQTVDSGVVGIACVADEPVERLALTPMFRRNTSGRALRFEGEPMSCSSVVTIVAKFGQCLSGSSEKNVASWR